MGPGSGAVRRLSLAAPSGGKNKARLAPESAPSPSSAPSRPFPPGETGSTVCGYMGLDGASGSAAETQKLNFEEQPDSRVRVRGRRSYSCSHPCLSPREKGSFIPVQKPRDRYGGWETGVLHGGCARELGSCRSRHVRRGEPHMTRGGRFITWRRAEMSRPYPRDLRRNSVAPRPCTSQMQTKGSISGWCCG